MKRATVHVDLANKSCVVADGTTQHGAWGPDITRTTAAAAIARDGWQFAPGSSWRMTIDGGIREVVHIPQPSGRHAMSHLDPASDDLSAVQADDALLTMLGSAVPNSAGHLVDDQLNALLLAWRDEAEAKPMPVLVDLDTALATVATAARSWWTTNSNLRTATALLLVVVTVVALVLTIHEAAGR